MNNAYLQGIWEVKSLENLKAIKEVKIMEAKAVWINWRSQESQFWLFLFFFDIHKYLNLGGLVVGTLFLELDFTFICH